MTSWVLIHCLTTAPVLAQEPPRSGDYRSYIDQARLFVRREWFEDAEEQLRIAVGTDDGALDPEAWFLLARVRYQLADLGGAREAADRALVHSTTPEQTAQASELLAFFDRQFGWVELVPPHPGVATRLELELQSVLFDPELKAYTERLLARLDDRIVLPTSLGLPAGTWSINGDPVDIVAGEEQSLSVAIRGRAPLGLQVTQLEVGLGVGAWLGRDARGLLPQPAVQLAISQPVGPLVVGVLGEWAPQPHTLHDGAVALGARGWAVGGRLGGEVGDTEPLVFRPSLGYRYAAIPGRELACASDGDGFACTADLASAARQLYTYPTVRAHIPFVELAAILLSRERSSGLGAGLKVIGELASGTVPAAAASRDVDTRRLYSWSLDAPSRRWQSPGVRVLLDVTYAL